MSKRNIYLKTVSVAEALERARNALDRARIMKSETVATQEADGRITAAPVYARASSPRFHVSAMDGIAVLAENTFAAREDEPLTLRQNVDFFPVNTGQPLPAGTNAVIKIEDVLPAAEENRVRIEAPAFPWMHVRRTGEDIVASELLLPRNHPLSPYDIGALLTAGVWEIEVCERVSLTFIPTGDEVLDFIARPDPQPGQVIESNSQVFCALAHRWGAHAQRVPPVPDDPERLRTAVEAALASSAHVVVVGAGSSAGTRDFTRGVFEKLGEVLVHGLAVSPGKPALLAVAGGKLLVGAPGYPSSAIVCFEEIIAPLVAWLEYREPAGKPTARAHLARKIPSRLGVEEIVRLAVGKVGKKTVAVPLGRGVGVISSLTRAQALTRVPADREGLDQGEEIDIELLTSAKSLERTLVHVGSHDNTIDLIADTLMGLPEPLRLVSSNVGSLGGLTALRDAGAMLAGAHLFDPESEDFNFPFLQRYLPQIEVLVVNLAIRIQGLIVVPGNPKDIGALADLIREDVTFINRQRGSGTRILLDHHLKKSGIDPGAVHGYQREEFTHMAVAVNVLTGSCDCALGIQSAARALGLDFIPLFPERYDLIISADFAGDPRIRTLLELLENADFQARIRALGGYDTRLTGQVMQPGMGLGS